MVRRVSERRSGCAEPLLRDGQPARRNLVRPPGPSERQLGGRCTWEGTL